MKNSYMTKKGFPLNISKLEDIDFAKILSNFDINRKDVKFTLPRIVFIGNFRTLSLTCHRYLAKNLGFEYIEGIPFDTISPEKIQLFANKLEEITKNYTKLIILGHDSVTSFDDGTIELDTDAEKQLFKTYVRHKEPLYLKYKIPVTLETEIIRLHSEYPIINNITSWVIEPKLKYPKPLCEELESYTETIRSKDRSDGIQFGYNCRYLVPQHLKCEKLSKERISETNLTEDRWLDISKAILYSKIFDFDLVEKVKKGEIIVKHGNGNTNGKDSKSIKLFLKAAFEYDDCSLFNCGGTCMHFKPHTSRKINCLMDKINIKDHPNYERYILKRNERDLIIKSVTNTFSQQKLFDT